MSTKVEPSVAMLIPILLGAHSGLRLELREPETGGELVLRRYSVLRLICQRRRVEEGSRSVCETDVDMSIVGFGGV
jgi:hypothetical protein